MVFFVIHLVSKYQSFLFPLPILETSPLNPSFLLFFPSYFHYQHLDFSILLFATERLLITIGYKKSRVL